MAEGDIINMVASGTYCGQPVAISMAYRQDRDDPASVTPGRDLALSWFTNVGGPWWFWRTLLSDQLKWDCVTTAWPGNAETTFLEMAMGDDDGRSTPSPICAQVNVPALRPHPNKKEGRFYMPGLPASALQRSGYTQQFQSNVQVPLQAMLRISSVTDQVNNAYYLVPHAGYRDAQLSTLNAEAYLPYLNLFVKALARRKTDTCGAFLGGGGGDFIPGVVPPAPALTMVTPTDGEQIATGSGDYSLLCQVENVQLAEGQFKMNGAAWGQPGVFGAAPVGEDGWGATRDADSMWEVGTNTIIFEGRTEEGMSYFTKEIEIELTA